MTLAFKQHYKQVSMYYTSKRQNIFPHCYFQLRLALSATIQENLQYSFLYLHGQHSPDNILPILAN